MYAKILILFHNILCQNRHIFNSKVIDFDTDWVKLEWDKPEFDGGSTITGYIIEKRDKQFQKWEVCTRSEGETPICKVSNLIEGSIYEFRVRAVNKAGESEPSDPSIPHRYVIFNVINKCNDLRFKFLN